MDELVSKAMDVQKLFDLSGKVALVTGGAKGLGEAMALALAGAGADVAIAGKTQANNQKAADKVTSMGRESMAIEVEVRDENLVINMVREVMKKWGKSTLMNQVITGYLVVHLPNFTI